MGCICSKGNRATQFVEEHNVKVKVKAEEEKKKGKKKLSSFKKDNVVETEVPTNDATLRLINNQSADNSAGSGTGSGSSDEGEKKGKGKGKRRKQKHGKKKKDDGSGGLAVESKMKRETSVVSNREPKMGRISSVRNGERGAQVVAGWPSWLTAVAGEAINGWVPRKADSFEKLDKVSLLNGCVKLM